MTQKNNFTAIVLGKRIVALFLLLISIALIVFCTSVTFVCKFNSLDINQKTVCAAVPVFGAQSVDFKKSISEVIYAVTGVYPGNKIYNLGILPVFASLENEDSVSVFLKVPEVKNTTIPNVKISDQSNTSNTLEIKNETEYTVDVKSLIKSPLKIKLDGKNPEILIVHTHGTESYTQSVKYNYSKEDNSRCRDTKYNVVRVGDELENKLKKYGLNVIHDKTLNDYPSYNSSYEKTLGVIESYLKKYPTIKCVFDIHRDALEREDGTKIKFTTNIKNEKVSQVMIVCGSDGLGLSNPNWQENLGFALKIQEYLNNKYPGLMRPLNLRKERFNMHKTTGSLIFEVGTHGNTLDEALASCKYLAEGIAKTLKKD